jgi:hypothetical protein
MNSKGYEESAYNLDWDLLTIYANHVLCILGEVGYLEKVMLQDPSSRASALHVYAWFIPNLISLDELGEFDAIFGVNYAESNKIIYARKDSQCFQSQLRQLSRALVGRDFNRPSNEEATHLKKLRFWNKDRWAKGREFWPFKMPYLKWSPNMFELMVLKRSLISQGKRILALTCA